MSNTSYFAIVFSPQLSQQGKEEKLRAIKNLKEYFESRPEINTGDEAYYPASYATQKFFDGTVDLSKTFRTKVICAELANKERVDVQRMGFSVSVVGPHAFTFYAEPKSSEP